MRVTALAALGLSVSCLAAGGTALAQGGHAHHAAPSAIAVDPALAAAVADKRRDADRARDQWRHPAETLAFFGVAPTMKVGEYAPGGGWYSRILGAYLGPKGKLVGLFFDPTSGAFSPERQPGIRDAAAKFPAQAAEWTGQPVSSFAALTLDAVPDAEKESFDLIIVPRMLHNLLRWNIADSEIRAMRSLLKPGGMIGIEQHRAKADAPFSYADGSKGYLRQADVVALMQAHGFDLVRQSEVNANPKDSADWPDGAWTLPPTLAKKDVDRARYVAIGETDRMTLLFRKRP